MSKPDETTSALFHKAWGQARNSPDYDKQVWKDLEAKLWSTPPRAPAAHSEVYSSSSSRDQWARDKRAGTLDD